METQVQESPPVPAAPERPKINVDALFDKVGRYFETIPSTRPLDYLLSLDELGLTEQETAYLSTVLRNSKRDELRQDRVWRKHFCSLDGLLEDAQLAEEEKRTPEFVEPSVPSEEPEQALQIADFEARFRVALLELPIELAAMVYALPRCGGNVSRLARGLCQPQRRTARLIDRIRQHFAVNGLSV